MYVYSASIACYPETEQVHHLKHVFARKHLVRLKQVILSANHFTYQSVMTLDKEIRNDDIPSHLRVGANPPSGFGLLDESLMLQRYLLFLTRQFGQSFIAHYLLSEADPDSNQVFLQMHRSYSCRAAFEMPSNPLKHPFGPSVLASYKSATAITNIMADLVERQPTWTPRLIPVYPIVFCAATTLGSLAIFAPRWSNAAHILMQLDKICAFFEVTKATPPHTLLVRSPSKATHQI